MLNREMRRRTLLTQAGTVLLLAYPHRAAALFSAGADAQSPADTSSRTDPWPIDALIPPQQLADRLKNDSSMPSIFYVGFPVLYRAAHLPGAKLAGPCSKPEGLSDLRALAGKLPRERQLFLYCGCCPFDHCPNIRPAYTAIHDLGFRRVGVLDIPTNLHADWIAKGYPTEKPGKS